MGSSRNAMGRMFLVRASAGAETPIVGISRPLGLDALWLYEWLGPVPLDAKETWTFTTNRPFCV